MRPHWISSFGVAALSLATPLSSLAGQPQPCSVADVSVEPVTKYATENFPVSFNVNRDQDVQTYSWTQWASDPVQVQMAVEGASQGKNGKMSFKAPEVGPAGATLHFELTVSGCGGRTKTVTGITANIANVATNAAPAAAFTVQPATIFEGEGVALDGTGSSDPDGDALTYTWSAPGLSLTSTNGATTGFTAPQVPYPNGATYEISLTVSDGALSSTVSHLITVQWLNEPPVADLKCPAEVNEGADVVLDGTGSTDDEDGIASYSWNQTAGGPTATLPPYDPAGAFSLTFQAPGLTDPVHHTMTFQLTVADNGGLAASQACDVLVRDVTPPVIICGQPDGQWHGNDASVACTAADVGSGLDCAQDASFALTTDVAEGTETTDASTGSRDVCDAVGNCATAGPIGGNKVDRKAPSDITFAGSIRDGAAYYYNFVPANDVTCAATDGGSGVKGCEVSGYSNLVGSHTLTATATDNVGNWAQSALSFQVNRWTLKGFYQPVEMNNVLNVVKKGSTVPLKFEVFAGPTELTDASYIKLSSVPVVCDTGTPAVDMVESDLTATGGTVLRYDAIAGQFLYNWKTPGTAGACYRVTMATIDGSSLQAYFKLK